ncbi:hypothetical protein AA0111_g8254 [Alternaria arborescens]|nr:hypothetical protein AA0111_g8254 [Alternaria arborescens]RYO26381.1 hypothetical protein AA0111_g8254 [Alternaria arborescens]
MVNYPNLQAQPQPQLQLQFQLLLPAQPQRLLWAEQLMRQLHKEWMREHKQLR